MSYTRPERDPICWCYGSAAISFGIKNNAFSYLLLIYATQVLGIPGYLAGAALAIALAWDAVSDPLVGHWSDKTRSRLGRRHPFMYAALVLLPLSFYAMFNPPIELTEANRWFYLLGVALLIRTSVTLFEVPSVALLPDLVKDYDERNHWLTMRHGFGWYGGNGIHIINMFFWVGSFGVVAQAGYSIYGVAGALAIAASILVSSLGTQQVASALPPPSEPFRIRELWRELQQIGQSLRNPNFLWLFVYSLLVGAAAGLAAALYLYNVYYFFLFDGYQIAITGLFVLASPIIAYLLVPALSGRLGKKRAAMAALVGAIFLYPLPYLLTLAGFWPAAGSAASLIAYSLFVMAEVVGFIIGGALLDSMMADVVEDSEVKTSRRSEGLFYAARSFAGKAVSALGVIFAGTIVSLVGMDGIKAAADMTPSMRADLASVFLPIYCGLYLAAIWLIGRYRIDRAAHNSNLATLAQKG